jgi:UDP-glucose 4-epimerase
LLADGWRVVGLDDFSTGRERFLANAKRSERFALHTLDLLDAESLDKAMSDAQPDVVFHLAANADISRGLENPEKDLRQNTIATFHVLDAMRKSGVKRIVFSSTGSIYGEPAEFPTRETSAFPIQTSLYGASKLAGEGLITAFCHGYGFDCWIFRFVSVLGERYTHGHVFDFYRKLRADPQTIQVLGNGLQRKSYMHVGDCVDGLLTGLSAAPSGVNIFNLGTDATIQVKDSLALIVQSLGLDPVVEFGGGERGWVGDSPFIHLDCGAIRALGWRPKRTIEESVVLTLDWLRANQWVFGEAAA